MVNEDITNCRASRMRIQNSDFRQHIRSRNHGTFASLQKFDHDTLGINIASYHKGHFGSGLGQDRRVVNQDGIVTTIGTANQKHNIWTISDQCLNAGAIKGPTRHVHNLGTSR
jgi:hypothetical protein